MPEELEQAIQFGLSVEGRVTALESRLGELQGAIERFVPVIEKVLPVLEGAVGRAPAAGASAGNPAQEPTSAPGADAPNVAAGPIPVYDAQPGGALWRGLDYFVRMMEASKPAPVAPPPGSELAPALNVLGDLFKVVTQLRKMFLDEFKAAHKAGLLEETKA